jgi:hypothetical protein
VVELAHGQAAAGDGLRPGFPGLSGVAAHQYQQVPDRVRDQRSPRTPPALPDSHIETTAMTTDHHTEVANIPASSRHDTVLVRATANQATSSPYSHSQTLRPARSSGYSTNTTSSPASATHRTTARASADRCASC